MATRPLALAISGKYAYAATYSRGVYASSDGGRSWREPAPGQQLRATLAIAPGDPTVVYAGLVGPKAHGLYRSTNAGRTWQHLTHGIEDTDIYAVALDSTHPKTIYIGTGAEGVFNSDGGANWRPATSGLNEDQIAGITALAIDPAKPVTALRRHERKQHLQKHRRRIELAALQLRPRRLRREVARHRCDRSHPLRRQPGRRRRLSPRRHQRRAPPITGNAPDRPDASSDGLLMHARWVVLAAALAGLGSVVVGVASGQGEGGARSQGTIAFFVTRRGR